MLDSPRDTDVPATTIADHVRPRRSILTSVPRWLYRFGAGFVGVYAFLIVFLLANETRLVYPAPKFDPSDWSPLPENVEEMWGELENGWRVHGWYLTRPQAERVVLLCHGNAEDVARTAKSFGKTLSVKLNANVLIFDYPGYGKSTGSPFEDVLIESGNVALTWLCRRTELLPREIIIYGRSLGGGIAVALAQRHGGRALVLDRTFDAITSPGQARFPWAPVALLMRNRYPSAERIADCAMPVFVSHFEGDEVIPLWSGKRLFDAAQSATIKEFLQMPGGDHLAPLPAEYWQRLNAFLERVESNVGQPQLISRE